MRHTSRSHARSPPRRVFRSKASPVAGPPPTAMLGVGPRGSLLRPRAAETQQERSAHPAAPSGRHWSSVYGAAAPRVDPLAAPPAPDRRVRPRGRKRDRTVRVGVLDRDRRDECHLAGRPGRGRRRPAARRRHARDARAHGQPPDRKSTRLNSSHVEISYAVFCLKKKSQAPGCTAVAQIIQSYNRLKTKRTVFISGSFYNDTSTTEIYTLSLHDALPI